MKIPMGCDLVSGFQKPPGCDNIILRLIRQAVNNYHQYRFRVSLVRLILRFVATLSLIGMLITTGLSASCSRNTTSAVTGLIVLGAIVWWAAEEGKTEDLQNASRLSWQVTFGSGRLVVQNDAFTSFKVTVDDINLGTVYPLTEKSFFIGAGYHQVKVGPHAFGTTITSSENIEVRLDWILSENAG